MSRSWEVLKKKLIERGQDRGFKSDFARKMELPPQSVQRYFNPDDSTVPSLDQADRMMDALGIKSWELLKPADDKPTESRESVLGRLVGLLGGLDKGQLKILVIAAKAMTASPKATIIDIAEKLKKESN